MAHRRILDVEIFAKAHANAVALGNAYVPGFLRVVRIAGGITGRLDRAVGFRQQDGRATFS